MTSPEHENRHHRGQILVLTGMMMLVLLAIVGLAIDISSALVTQRLERAAADAAALAGAQDLQVPGSQQSYAGADAMDVLVVAFGASSTPSTGAGSSCLSSAGCPLPGTPYVVSIQTPSPSCVECLGQEDFAVQVTINNPAFGLTFARILRQTQWTVGASSVASIGRGRSYGAVTLRPPKPRANGNGDAYEKDLTLNDGSSVHVLKGPGGTSGSDVGTNTNLWVHNNATLTLQLGKVYHYDAYQLWTGPPPGVQVSTLIKDPLYAIPTRVVSSPTYSNITQAKDSAANCAIEQAKVPAPYKIRDGTSIKDLPSGQVSCFKPGVYQFNLNNSDRADAFLLEPGVYFFDGGLQSSSTVVGGYEGGQPGVALVFNECDSFCDLKANSSDLWAMNVGDAAPFGNGSRATAAVGPQGPVQTSTATQAPMSLMVVPDPNCVVIQPYPSACNDAQNNTIKLGRPGAIYVGGVLYAPSDNVTLGGNTDGTGKVGAIYAWTLTYDSGQLDQESAQFDDPGTLRLDSACSPGSGVCNP